MTTIRREILIGRVPEDVFGQLADVERFPDWQRGTRVGRVLLLGDDRLGPGSRFRMERRFAGRRLVWLDCRITTFDPPARLSYRSVGWRYFDLAVDVTCERERSHTRLTWTTRLSTPLALRPLGPLIAREVGHALSADLAALKSLLESVAGLPGG